MSSSDSEGVDNPAAMDTPRSKRKLQFYGSDAKKRSRSSRVRKVKTKGGKHGGYQSDVSVDDSDKDPDFVLEEPSTPVEVPVNVGALTSRGVLWQSHHLLLGGVLGIGLRPLLGVMAGGMVPVERSA